MKAFCSRWCGTFLFLLVPFSIGRSADRVGLIFGNGSYENAGILDDSFVVTQDSGEGSSTRPAPMAQTSPERTASPDSAPPQGASPAALARSAPEGRRVVLSVGVDDPKKEGIPQLTAADSDAEKIAEAFRNSGSNDDRIVAMTSASSHDAREGYSAPLYPSTENIRTMMEAEFSELRPQDLAVFSFAGYEVQREGDDDFYFMTGGGDNEDPATLISLSEVYQAILDSGAGSGLVLIDACRHNESSTPLSPPPGISVFFSCSQGEFAIESAEAGSPSGLFTETFVSAMEGAADFDGNGKVEWEELTEHVIREVARRASLLETPASQVPELFGTPRRAPVFAVPAAVQ